jgi:hypothetical protein
MRNAVVAMVVLTAPLVAGCAVSTQERGSPGGYNSQGIPPGHLPPPGMCRVWYADRPAGHQPAATSCGEARAIATRSRTARVIYGDRDRQHDRDGGRDRQHDRYGDRAPQHDRAIPRRTRSDEYRDAGFQHGYDDGYLQGRTDARTHGGRSDVTKHARYRSADRGYRTEYASREQYRTVYRDGFKSGYEEGFRSMGNAAQRRR